MVKVSEIMRVPVASVAPKGRVIDAIRLLLETNRRGLPVVSKSSELVGMLSEENFLRRSELETEGSSHPWLAAIFGPDQEATDFIRSHGLKVEEVMTHSPAWISVDESLRAAVDRMEVSRTWMLPVLDGSKVVGTVTMVEILGAIERHLRELDLSPPSRSPTRDEILKEIREQEWSAGTSVDLSIKEGHVEIWGVVIDQKQREAIQVLVENLSGVVSISSHLRLQGSRSL